MFSRLPVKIYQCHCTLCKKQSGSSSNSATIIQTERFEWLAGGGYIRTWKKETGFNAHFCGQCGSPVPNEFAGEYIWIPVGLLDIKNEVKVVANLCLNSHASWHILSEHAEKFEETAEFNELMSLLAN